MPDNDRNYPVAVLGPLSQRTSIDRRPSQQLPSQPVAIDAMTDVPLEQSYEKTQQITDGDRDSSFFE
jgi:hypothetical protein